jgi:hypothetical protein
VRKREEDKGRETKGDLEEGPTEQSRSMKKFCDAVLNK